jgi:hypothetical protein
MFGNDSIHTFKSVLDIDQEMQSVRMGQLKFFLKVLRVEILKLVDVSWDRKGCLSDDLLLLGLMDQSIAVILHFVVNLE